LGSALNRHSRENGNPVRQSALADQLVIDSRFRENDRKGAFFEGKYDLTILDLITI
jgi:hypothetical protein